MKPRVVIVDDHTLLAEAFGKLVAEYCDVVGRFGDAWSFLDRVGDLRPDVVVLDISLPVINGLEVARKLREVLPSARIIFLTMNEDPDVAAAAFRAGGSAYVLKRSAGSELETAVRQVMSGRQYVTPLLREESAGERERISQAHQLTARQREVLQLLTEGRSMKEAAAVLNVSARTVAFHKYRMMKLLHARTTAALIQIAVREGLV
jgi:DNA-binding NarL/FixJ family response regulator